MFKTFFRIKVLNFNIIFTSVGIYCIHKQFNFKSAFLRNEIPGIKFRLSIRSFFYFLKVLIISSCYLHRFNHDYIKNVFFVIDDFTKNNQELILSNFLRILNKGETSDTGDLNFNSIKKFYNFANSLRLHALVRDDRIHVSRKYDYSNKIIYHEMHSVKTNEQKFGKEALKIYYHNIQKLNLDSPFGLENVETFFEYLRIKKEMEIYKEYSSNTNNESLDFKSKKIQKAEEIFKNINFLNPKKKFKIKVKIFTNNQILNENITLNSSPSMYIKNVNFKTFDRLSIVQNDVSILDESFQEHPNVFYYRENFPWLNKLKHNRVDTILPRQFVNIKNGVLCSVGLPTNYFTWLIETLPRIYEASKISKNKTLYVIGEEKKWHRDYLKLCNLNKNVKFLDPEQYYNFENSDISITSIREIPNDQSLINLKNNLLSKNINKGPFFPKIYISRKKFLSHRYLINELEIENYLLKYGFKIIEPENLTVFEQINIFQNAEIIIGPTGAWASNLIFCKKKPDVYIITPMDHLGKFFGYISYLSRCNFNWLGSLPISEFKDDRIHNDHYLDLSILKSLKL